MYFHAIFMELLRGEDKLEYSLIYAMRFAICAMLNRTLSLR